MGQRVLSLFMESNIPGSAKSVRVTVGVFVLVSSVDVSVRLWVERVAVCVLYAFVFLFILRLSWEGRLGNTRIGASAQHQFSGPPGPKDLGLGPFPP